MISNSETNWKSLLRGHPQFATWTFQITKVKRPWPWHFSQRNAYLAPLLTFDFLVFTSKWLQVHNIHNSSLSLPPIREIIEEWSWQCLYQFEYLYSSRFRMYFFFYWYLSVVNLTIGMLPLTNNTKRTLDKITKLWMFSLNTLFPTIEPTYLLGKLYEGRHIVICSIFLIKGLREVIISGAPVFLSRFTICPIVRSQHVGKKNN